MDRALEILLSRKDGSNQGMMGNMIWRMMSPKIVPVAEKVISDVVGTIENPKCADAMVDYVNSIFTHSPHLWALRMLDATAKAPQGLLAGGGALLGDYDECVRTRAPRFDAKYCLLTACGAATAPDGAIALDAPCARDALRAPAWRRFPLQEGEEALEGLPLRVGLCVPSVCSAADVSALAGHVLQAVAPTAHTGLLRLELEDDACHVGHGLHLGFADVFAILTVLGIGLVIAAFTAYDYVTQGAQRRRFRLPLCFSARSNFEHLLRAQPPPPLPPARSDALPVVHGLRALSLLWVVCAHALAVATRLPLANGQHYLQVMAQGSASVVTAGFLGLDTLLLLSGALTAYAFLRRATSGRRFYLVAHHLLRLARYLPSLGMVLFLQSTIFLKLRDGPLWHLTPARQCSQSWPYILLQICNYFRPDTVQCMEHAWFLSLEWQLFALAPLLLVALWRRPRRTQAALAALCVVGVALRFWTAYTAGLRAPWGSTNTKEALKALYFPTHVRFTPYLMGIILGYELHRMKHLEVACRLSKRTVVALQLMWPLLLIWSVVGVQQFGSSAAPHSALLEALFLALVHSAWASGVAIFVYLSAAGMPVLGGYLLSLDAWQPVSRLGYGVYLLHGVVLEAVTYDARFAMTLCVWQQVAAAVLAFGVSLVLATFLWLTLEAPVARLVALIGDTPKDFPKSFAEACGEGRQFVLFLLQPLLDPAGEEFDSTTHEVAKENLFMESYRLEKEEQRLEVNVKQPVSKLNEKMESLQEYKGVDGSTGIQGTFYHGWTDDGRLL